MNRLFIIIIAIVVVLVAGFFTLNNYIYNEKQADSEATEIPVVLE